MFFLPYVFWVFFQQEPAQKAVAKQAALFIRFLSSQTVQLHGGMRPWSRGLDCGCLAKPVNKRESRQGRPFSCSGSWAKLLALQVGPGTKQNVGVHLPGAFSSMENGLDAYFAFPHRRESEVS